MTSSKDLASQQEDLVCKIEGFKASSYNPALGVNRTGRHVGGNSHMAKQHRLHEGNLQHLG